MSGSVLVAASGSVAGRGGGSRAVGAGGRAARTLRDRPIIALIAAGCVFVSAPARCADHPFIRGDCNGDGRVSGEVSDAIFLLHFLFLGSAKPPCTKACDVNDDGDVNGVTDAIAVLSFNFLGGPAPPAPYPECGLDPTADGLDCSSSPACPLPPTASFTAYPTSGIGPLEVQFDASASSDPDGDIVSYAWDFGDGETGSGSTTSHTYAAVEKDTSHRVKLTVTDAAGLTATANRLIRVRKPNVPPTAAFHFFPTGGAAPLTVRFYGWDSVDPGGGVTQYDWNFGDGATATGAGPTHIYRTPGTYTVTLNVKDGFGEEDAATATLVVGETEPYAERFVPFVRTLRDEMLEYNATGVAIAMVEGGEVTFAEGFGFRHPRKPEPVLPTTLFRIASLTKMLTAAGILQLVDEGKVALEAPITTYLPTFSFGRNAAWAPSISVRNLITHTTGIYDYLEIDSTLRSDGDLRDYFLGPYKNNQYAALMAPAGRMYNYCNTGFMLAGLIAETVSSSYYRDYMRSRVFEPLGMHRTFFLPSEVLADGDYATGDNNPAAPMPDIRAPDAYDNAWARPCGYAFSSVLDMAQFVKFLRNGNPSVLSDELRLEMQSPQVNTEEFLDDMHYGYGLGVQESGYFHPTNQNFYRLRFVSHGGALPGFALFLAYVPSLDFGYIAFANASGAYFNKSLGTALTTLCAMPDPVPVPDLSNPPEEFPLYTGTYLDPYGDAGTIEIGAAPSALTIYVTNYTSWGVTYNHTLRSYCPRNWLFDVTGWSYTTQLTFLLDAEGKGEYIRERFFVGRRKDSGKGGAASWEFSVPPFAAGLPEPMRSEAMPRFIRPPPER